MLEEEADPTTGDRFSYKHSTPVRIKLIDDDAIAFEGFSQFSGCGIEY